MMSKVSRRMCCGIFIPGNLEDGRSLLGRIDLLRQTPKGVSGPLTPALRSTPMQGTAKCNNNPAPRVWETLQQFKLHLKSPLRSHAEEKTACRVTTSISFPEE